MAEASVLVVPQWQGSVHGSAQGLATGAERLGALVAAPPPVEVDDRRSARRHGVDSYEVLLATRARTAAALPPGPVFTLGGDCGADLAPVARELDRRDGDLALLWIDAHADFNTPTTSPSGAFHGMVLRALTGVGAPGLLAAPAVHPEAVVLVGTRSVDPGEADQLADAGVRPWGMRGLLDPSVVVDHLLRTGRSAVHVHLDLDVLDPGVFPHVGYPAPGGASVEQVLALLDAVAAELPVVSAFVGEHLHDGDPGSVEVVAPLVRRLLSALQHGAP